MPQKVTTDSHPARMFCANCMGEGVMVIGWTEFQCQDCDGTGFLFDLDGVQEKEKAPQ